MPEEMSLISFYGCDLQVKISLLVHKGDLEWHFSYQRTPHHQELN